jgi:hypothetical protein
MNTARIGTLAAALALLWTAIARPVRAESLAQGLQKQAPEVMKYLREQGYRNVGVLKFRVKKGDKVSDRVGTLNTALASRLETALLLAEDSRLPVGLIRDASGVAASIPGADHRTAEGRLKLFGSDKYPLLWGTDTVAPDAFVTGLALLRPDGKTMAVALCVIDKQTMKEPFRQFVVDVDPSLLIETGSSFRLRGLLDDGQLNTGPGSSDKVPPSTQQKVDAAVQDAIQVVRKSEPPPMPDKGPVVLDIFYGDNPVEYSVSDANEIQIPEPGQGQRVKFVLRKTDKAHVRYGVVVKVNGENTLFMEKGKVEQCTKWILSDQVPTIEVEGYQVSNTEARPFIIRSPEESKAVERQYGKDVGQISFVVFREKTAAEQKAAPDEPPGDLPREELPPGKKPAPPSDDDARVQLAIDLGLAESDSKLAKANTPEEAQQAVNERAEKLQKDRQRGIVGPAEEKTGSEITHVEFKTDPVPIQASTVIYYRARSKP